MICIYNKIIEQRQGLRKEIRGHTISKYRKESWVFLKRNSRKKDRLSQILDHKYWSPFRIKKQVNKHFYKLNLSNSIKIYFIFDTYRLKEVYKEQETRKELEVTEEQKEYKVEEITREKDEKFRIKWKRYNRQS